MAATSASDIPGEDEITTKFTIFGVEVELTPLEWMLEPITKVNADGTGGGQLRALNTVLSEAGFEGKDRHWVTLAILDKAYGTRAVLDSLNDLKKNEASVALNFFDAADDAALDRLYEAAQQRKGAIPMKRKVKTEVAA
jgi:hypothetical protein